MRNLPQEVTSGRMTVKQAFDEIGELLKTATPEETEKLIGMSNWILDFDQPMPETNYELDKAWHAQNSRED